jgi:peptide/nickel transport system substrate-binding protein
MNGFYYVKTDDRFIWKGVGKMGRLRKARIGIMLGIFFLLIAWQISPAFAETPKRGGWLTVATDSTAVGLDPHLSIVHATFTFTEHVYDCLLRYNYNMELEPALAVSWEQPDDLIYVFHLRKGVKFHNGREMTSEDVKFSFDRIMDPKTGSPSRSTFKAIKSVEALDKYTVKFTLGKTMPAFLDYLAFVRNSAIVPKDEVLKHGTLQKVMIGTGPFKLKEYKHGVGATFVRNEDYWEPGLPYIDGFKFPVVKDEASRLAGLRRGAYDIGWVKGVQTAMLAAKEPNVRIVKSAPARQGRFWLNHKVAPFNNVKLRQAVSACLDRKAIIEKVLLGNGVLSSIIPPSAVPYVLPQEEIARLPFYKQDYALAKKLLKEAGYPDGFEFTIKTSPHSPDYVPASEIIQDQLSKAGIKAKIQQMEWGAFQKVRRSVDFQAVYFAGSWRADPADYFYTYMHGKSSANEVGQDDPEINRLMDLCLTTTNVEKRKEYFKQLQYAAAEKVTGIFTYASASRFEIVRDRVKGYHFMANNGRAYLRQAWISE